MILKRAGILTTLALASIALLASDHKEAPVIQESNPADIADLYAFRAPDNPENLVLVMTVNPLSVPVEAISFNFSPAITYRFNIDNNGDAVEDHIIDVNFRADQSYSVLLPDGTSMSGQATAPTEEPVANDPIIVEADGVRVFTGPRDDPFFFDFVGFNRVLAGTGPFTENDSFAGLNVSAIVIELPSAMVMGDSSTLNIWAVTGNNISFKNRRGFFKQKDRVGNPAVATALIPAGEKDTYNRTSPASDAELWAPSIVASLQALGTNDENIGVLASVAVPDVLTIDMSADSAFPNGRGLADDVVDTLFHFIFNQAGVSDGVAANDTDFSNSFPYLAAPWQPE